MVQGEHVDQPLHELITEARVGRRDLGRQSTRDLVGLMNAHDTAVPEAVAAEADAIAGAIDAIVLRLGRGGRLVYVGAGSSGRIAELDAGECEATFSTEPGQVIALVAGSGLHSAAEREGAEDDADEGRRATRELGLSAGDVLIGVSASGRTPYVLGALEAAAAAGALTVALVSVPDSELARMAEHEIAVVVGPEFIAGSTRLKAGTAQKLVLNAISTVVMIRLGKTYGDLMVDVRASNEKLAARACTIVSLATGASDEDVEQALANAGGSAKVAVVSLLAGVDAAEARVLLDRTDGHIESALER